MGRGLTKASIVAAALGLLDEVGLDGLTVRAVAARLGVQAPALYWHVRSKQDLLDEMATQIWQGIGEQLAALPPDLGWRQEMIAFASITRRTLLAHRDGAKVFTGTYLTDASVLENQEAGLSRMMDQGFTLADVIRAYSLLYSFVIGFCIEEQAVAQATAAGDDRYALERRAARLDQEAHPLTVQAGPEIFADPDGRFEDLVGMIVQATDGMRGSPLRSAARVAAAAAATAARQRRLSELGLGPPVRRAGPAARPPAGPGG
ncbi:MAG TPA: TetR/AcrR family transcriptional regulator C-terminal domain-containing protein [Streptosporangiaceae bacterium]